MTRRPFGHQQVVSQGGKKNQGVQRIKCGKEGSPCLLLPAGGVRCASVLSGVVRQSGADEAILPTILYCMYYWQE